MPSTTLARYTMVDQLFHDSLVIRRLDGLHRPFARQRPWLSPLINGDRQPLRNGTYDVHKTNPLKLYCFLRFFDQQSLFGLKPQEEEEETGRYIFETNI